MNQLTVDINCDLGEGLSNDEALMPLITSANIACGFHAGNETTIWRTIDYCKKYNVAIGAHPGFEDKENFGRKEIILEEDAYYELVFKQLILFKKICNEKEVTLHHVKPHGALYNMAAKNKPLAAIIAKAVKDFDASLIFYGLNGSEMITAAKEIGLQTCSEVFADRTYQSDGTLTSRTEANALIQSTDESIKQVLKMVREQKVQSLQGDAISITAETICIHGDGEHAVSFAKEIYEQLLKENIQLKAPQ
jgi:5-oxoprolinase (ATP-hydrolysing) subunit A